jgi:mono/diheme cytochrome c family protein
MRCPKDWLHAIALTASLFFATPLPARAEDKALLERGRYLVHHVAMCAQCHSPRDEKGVLKEGELLQGAVVPLRSPYANQTWAFRAPRLAGLPGRTSSELVTLLTTGKTSEGRTPLPPMPPFRMSAEDASAVAAYLASLRVDAK